MGLLQCFRNYNGHVRPPSTLASECRFLGGTSYLPRKGKRANLGFSKQIWIFNYKFREIFKLPWASNFCMKLPCHLYNMLHNLQLITL